MTTMTLPVWHDEVLVLPVDNPYFDNDEGTISTIADLIDGAFANGLCDRTSQIIIEWLMINRSVFGLEMVRVDCININNQYDISYHMAILDKDIVYDYTMRQLDESLPFPYVGLLHEWVEIINKYVPVRPNWELGRP